MFLIGGVKLESLITDFDGFFSLAFLFVSHGLINREKLKV